MPIKLFSRLLRLAMLSVFLLPACGPGLCADEAICSAATTIFSVRAFPGNGKLIATWEDSVSGRSYDLRWSTSYPVTESNSTLIPNVSSPHGIAGLNNYQTYYVAVSHNRELSATAGTVPSEAPIFPVDSPEQGNKLPSNKVFSLSYFQSRLFVGTPGGLSMSEDGGATFTNKSTTVGIPTASTYWGEGLKVIGSSNTLVVTSPYAAAVSRDGGNTFVALSTTHGFVSTYIYGGAYDSGTFYVGTADGLAVSTDGARSFSYRTTAHGLPNNNVRKVWAQGLNVFAVSGAGLGLSVSIDGGQTFTTRTTANGLGSNTINAVVGSGSNIFVGTANGLSVSQDGGSLYSNSTTAQGLAANDIGVVALGGNRLFAGTGVGLSISSDLGASFTTRTLTHGLLDNAVTSIAYSDDGSLFVGSEAGISKSIDSGSTFSGISNPLSWSEASGAFCVSSNRIFVLSGVDLLISDDDGLTFRRRYSSDGAYELPTDVYCEASHVYLASQDGNVTTTGVSYSHDHGDTFTSVGTLNGLGNRDVFSIFGDGLNVYAATQSGLSISTDGGSSFTNRTMANGLANNFQLNVAGTGTNVFGQAVLGALSVSNNSGVLFTSKTTADGLGSLGVWRLFSTGNNLYVANAAGLSISNNGGASFTNRTIANGLSSNTIWDVWASGSDIYALADGTLCVSHDGGASFTSKSLKAMGLTGSGSKLYLLSPSGVASVDFSVLQ